MPPLPLNVPPLLFQSPTRLIWFPPADKIALLMMRFPETVMPPPSVGVPDAAWRAMFNRTVTVVLNDGREITGQLVGNELLQEWLRPVLSHSPDLCR